MHAAGEDMRICLLRTGAVPRRVFDVQIAAGLVGFSYPLSLVNLVAQVLRDLASRQRDADRLAAQAADAGPAPLRPGRRPAPARPGRPPREPSLPGWAGPTGPRRSSPTSSTPSSTGPTRSAGGGCRGCTSSTAGAGDGPAARRVARGRGPAQNRPLRQVMRDDLLVAIAKRQPASRRDLEALRDFNRPGLLQKSQAILAVLDQARAAPADQLPELAQRPDDSPGASTVANLLSAALAQLCAQQQGCGLARGQRVRPQAPDPLVPRWPARSRSPGAPARAGGASSAASSCSRSSKAGGRSASSTPPASSPSPSSRARPDHSHHPPEEA